MHADRADEHGGHVDHAQSRGDVRFGFRVCARTQGTRTTDDEGVQYAVKVEREGGSGGGGAGRLARNFKKKFTLHEIYYTNFK